MIQLQVQCILVSGRFCDAVCGSKRGDDATMRCHVTSSPELTEQQAVDDLHPGDVSPSSTEARLGGSDCRLCRHSCSDRASLQQHLVQVNDCKQVTILDSSRRQTCKLSLLNALLFSFRLVTQQSQWKLGLVFALQLPANSYCRLPTQLRLADVVLTRLCRPSYLELFATTPYRLVDVIVQFRTLLKTLLFH